MFKYLWIVMIALVVIYFIWYTVVCIIEAYQSTKDWPSALSRFSDEHDFLWAIWFVIILLIFVVSLCAYVKALE